MIGALQGATKDMLLSGVYSPTGLEASYWTERPLHPEIEALAQGSYKDKRLMTPEEQAAIMSEVGVETR